MYPDDSASSNSEPSLDGHAVANRLRSSTPPSTLHAPISPPQSRRTSHPSTATRPSNPKPSTSSVEAGHATIPSSAQLSYWTSHLASFTRPKHSLLSIPAFQQLYTQHQHARGSHFVIHQHDHPVAGLHYDLRLQINASSSVSWAIMYGLPGLVNEVSKRGNRNATETRVHVLWNHLVETASIQTGSMLIWDTGSYTILPYHRPSLYEQETSDSSSSFESDARASPPPEPAKLAQAFKNRKIRLRLHGSKLPRNYTITLRLASSNSENRHGIDTKALDATSTAPRKRRRRNQMRDVRQTPPRQRQNSTAMSEPSTSPTPELGGIKSVGKRGEGTNGFLVDGVEGLTKLEQQQGQQLSRDPKEVEDEEEQQLRIRRENAYPGADNTIGSVHQRRWYLSLDRVGCGFQRVAGRREWVKRRKRSKRKVGREGEKEGEGEVTEEDGGFEPFTVRGREVERSVVTGRLGSEMLRDEGVEGYVPRGLWTAVTE